VTAVEVTMWAVACDREGCDVRTDKDGHSVWLTEEIALKNVSMRDRFIGFSEDADGNHYCPGHSGFCEVCDDRKPLHTLVQDEGEGWWQCRRHLTEERPKPEEGVLGMRAALRQRDRG
jgi:hypothetical protein